MRADALDRWWAKVSTGEPDACWLWTGATNGKYGKFWGGTYTSAGNPRAVLAHRFGAQWVLGWDLADAEVVRHYCDTPLCCNPAHWRRGTCADNNGDTVTRGRHWNQRKTTCKHGHEFDRIEIRNGRTRRVCGTCKAASR